ncbi:MAG: S24 family peptidase [Sphingobacterium sp.]
MNTVDNRRKRLKEWFSDKSIPPKEKSFLSQLMNGKASFGEKAARRIERDYGMPLGFLDADCPAFNTQGSEELESPGYRVDVLDVEASAGPGAVISSEVAETVNHIVYDSHEALEIFGHRPASSIKVITVTGDSMAGTIELGDYIFVDVEKDYFVNDGIYVFFYKGKLLVKRLQLTQDCLLVRSDNARYEDWRITEENEQYLKVVGKVIYSHAIRRHG